MAKFAALLRAINVGGTGKLPMAELRSLCEVLGFEHVRTYIQSGNVVFTTTLSAARATAALEQALAERLGKPVGVFLRKAADLECVLADNPFPDAPTKRVLVVFYDRPLPNGALSKVLTPGGEQLSAHGKELYIRYPDGQGPSKLKVPAVERGTARNLNTVAKLVELLRAPD